MARPSNSAQRVIGILNLLSANPRTGFTLTDIIRGVQLNRATCHSLVNELVTARYLYRTSERTYMLGPALARLSRTARDSTPIEIALTEIKQLAARYSAACYLLAREKNETYVLEREISPALIDWPVPIGRRWSVHHAASGPLVAWASPDEIERWLKSIAPQPSAAQCRKIREGIAFARANGFFFHATSVERSRGSVMPASQQFPAFEEQSSLKRDASYDVHAINVPVLAQHGAVELMLFLTGFAQPKTGREIASIGEDIRKSCHTISTFFA